MKKPSQRIRNFILWSFVILAAAGLLIWAFTPKPLLVEIAEVHQGPYDQQVIEEGKTRAKDIFEIISPVDGELNRVEVDAGDLVNKGDILAIIEWPDVWNVRSPIKGKILRIKRESSGPITRGTVLMEVADPSVLEVVAEVLTEDAVQINEGAPVKIESWGGYETLEGKVRIIEPAAFTKVSALGVEEQRVKVIIDITSPKEKCQGLADSYRVNTLISTFQTKDALTIPTGALFRDGKHWAVFKLVNGRAVKTQVEIPRRNPESAMVSKGLKKGDHVIVYPSDEIANGTRVKAMNNSQE